MEKRPLIAGNWKMHKRISEAGDLVGELKSRLPNPLPAEVVLIPPFTVLKMVSTLLVESDMCLGAQNVSGEAEGAFTGEISASMLRDVGCEFVLTGHSERRNLYGETDTVINQKIKAAQLMGLQVIFCLGESRSERKEGKTKSLIQSQLEKGLEGISEIGITRLIIAYEPVWAIGTGENASPGQVQEVHLFIRNWIKSDFGEKVGSQIRIIYGGSVKPENSREFLVKPDIQGLLVGGASLNADSFYAIINSAE